LQSVCQAAGKRAGTAVFFEVPNALYTLRDLGIWDVIYEHCSYYSLPSLMRLFSETDFTAHEVYTTFGEQFLCLEAAVGARAVVEVDGVSAITELRSLVDRFATHFRAKVTLWEQELNRILVDGRRVVVWGAGSKGVTFLNTVAGGRRISAVVDINPRKQGMFVAGTGQQIVPPEWLAQFPADTILVMNPLYRDEIQQQIAQLGMFPDIRVV
jgi:hypothetical protein